MIEPDFSGIEPVRVPEARRRVAAISAYLDLHSPTSADATSYAARLDLSRGQFLRLVRVWRDHRKASLLVIGKRGKATRAYSVDSRATEIMKEVVAASGGSADLRYVAAEVEQRCTEERVKPPARATIYNNIREARALGNGHIDGSPRVVIGRMWFHLPIEELPAGSMPTLLVAVLLPERQIIAHRLSMEPTDPPSVEALVGDLLARRTAGANARALLVEPDDRRAAAEAFHQAGITIRPHYRSVQREISRAFGGRLGPLSAIYRRALARPLTRKQQILQGKPLTATEARMAVENAIVLNNAAVGSGAASFDISDDQDDSLRRGLYKSG